MTQSSAANMLRGLPGVGGHALANQGVYRGQPLLQMRLLPLRLFLLLLTLLIDSACHGHR